MIAPALRLTGIHKHFGSVHAVRGADFMVLPGEMHALLGENGAGKSTLMKIAAGLFHPESGQITLADDRVTFRNPQDARRAGIGMVHQHFTSIPAFSVQDNVALNSDWTIRPRELSRRVLELTQRLGFSLDPKEKAQDLTVAQLQRLEILKVMASGAGILILDEPTGSLSPLEADELLRLVRGLVERGSAAVLITHKLDEAVRYADRVTVLRQGSVTLTGPIEGKGSDDLAMAMLGTSLVRRKPGDPVPRGDIAVSAESMAVPPVGGKGPGIRRATFQIRGGEMVGIAAIEGNGEHELLRSIAGFLRPGKGKLSVTHPVALVPEDRSSEGIISGFTLAENLTLGLGDAAPWIHRGMIHQAESRAATARLLNHYQIIASGPDALAGTLSGGNQQKLILARALEQNPRVLIAENPGRGLDIRASQSAFEHLQVAARGGAGVLVYSSDLDELLEWCDRILVIARGEVYEPPAHADREAIGRLLLAVSE